MFYPQIFFSMPFISEHVGLFSTWKEKKSIHSRALQFYIFFLKQLLPELKRSI